MTELCITRGRDIGLYVGDEPLCGVTHFSAVSRFDRHEIYEYLSAAPYDTPASSESHELTLTVLSLFDGSVPTQGSFTLRAVDRDTEYCYEGCTVVKLERDVRGDKPVTDRFTVRAAGMTKRGTEDAR